MERLQIILLILFAVNAAFGLLNYINDPEKDWSNMSACLGWICAIIMTINIIIK